MVLSDAFARCLACPECGLPMTDPYSANFVEMIQDFLPVTKAINRLAVSDASPEGGVDGQGTAFAAIPAAKDGTFLNWSRSTFL